MPLFLRHSKNNDFFIDVINGNHTYNVALNVRLHLMLTDDIYLIFIHAVTMNF